MKKNFFIFIIMIALCFAIAPADAKQTEEVEAPYFGYYTQFISGAYIMNYYAGNASSVTEVEVIVNGISKGSNFPSETKRSKKDTDLTSELVAPDQISGSLAFYTPGTKVVKFCAYYNKSQCVPSNIYTLEVSVYEFFMNYYSSSIDTVTIGYYLRPLFLEVQDGDSIVISVNGNDYNATAQQNWDDSFYFQLDISRVEYVTNFSGFRETTVEINGHIVTRQIYYHN